MALRLKLCPVILNVSCLLLEVIDRGAISIFLSPSLMSILLISNAFKKSNISEFGRAAKY
jgi:hypothetical protein